MSQPVSEGGGRSEAAVLHAEGLDKRYQAASGPVAALQDVGLRVGRGSLTVVAGPSGSGKSTLLRILAGVDRPDGGTLRVAGADMTDASARHWRQVQRRHLAYVFQRPVDNLVGYLDAADHIRMWQRLRRVGTDDPDRWLSVVGLGGRAWAGVEQLSGGEQQRLAFAAAAASAPSVVLADEPTSQLDSGSTSLLAEALVALKELGTTMVVASHDPVVGDLADDILLLEHGRRV